MNKFSIDLNQQEMW